MLSRKQINSGRQISSDRRYITSKDNNMTDYETFEPHKEGKLQWLETQLSGITLTTPIGVIDIIEMTDDYKKTYWVTLNCIKIGEEASIESAKQYAERYLKDMRDKLNKYLGVNLNMF